MADSVEASLLSFLNACVGAAFNLNKAEAASVVSARGHTETDTRCAVPRAPRATKKSAFKFISDRAKF